MRQVLGLVMVQENGAWKIRHVAPVGATSEKFPGPARHLIPRHRPALLS